MTTLGLPVERSPQRSNVHYSNTVDEFQDKMWSGNGSKYFRAQQHSSTYASTASRPRKRRPIGGKLAAKC